MKKPSVFPAAREGYGEKDEGLAGGLFLRCGHREGRGDLLDHFRPVVHRDGKGCAGYWNDHRAVVNRDDDRGADHGDSDVPELRFRVRRCGWAALGVFVTVGQSLILAGLFFGLGGGLIGALLLGDATCTVAVSSVIGQGDSEGCEDHDCHRKEYR